MTRSIRPAWFEAKAVKLRGDNPRLSKLLAALDEGSESLARRVAQLKEANDRLEKIVKK